jgi:hypothetical protein
MSQGTNRSKPVLTAWRLVGIGATPDVSLSPSTATEFAPRYPADGVGSPDFSATVTVDANSGDALLERRGGFASTLVTAGGEIVTDVAHLSPGEEVAIDDQTWVYLKPMQIFFRTGSSREERRAALLKAFEQLPTSSALLRSAHLADSAAEASRERPLGAGRSSSTLASPAKRASETMDRLTRARVMKTAAWGGAGVVAALMVAGMLRQNGDAVVPAESVRVVTPSSAGVAPVASKAAEPQGNASNPELPPATRSVAQNDGVTSPTTPAAASNTPPAAAVVTTAPAAVPVSAPAASETKRQGAAAASKAPSRNMDPKLATQVRQKMAEYVLEARFDPEGARRKLEALLTEAPAGSGVATEIKRQIQLLPH